MASARIAITLEEELLTHVDRWVREGKYTSRSKVIQVAVREKLDRSRRRRLAEEAAKLDPKEERVLAEEGFAAGAETWPAYDPSWSSATRSSMPRRPPS
jgi:Arc/MetJ-type ribon-helix-helix transcriptional regulator